MAHTLEQLHRMRGALAPAPAIARCLPENEWMTVARAIELLGGDLGANDVLASATVYGLVERRPGEVRRLCSDELGEIEALWDRSPDGFVTLVDADGIARRVPGHLAEYLGGLVVAELRRRQNDNVVPPRPKKRRWSAADRARRAEAVS